MHSVKLYSALLAAGASVVSAASATCTSDMTITEPTPTITCDVVTGDINVAPSVAGNLRIEGPKQINGKFLVTNNTNIISISSTTINAFQGEVTLSNLEFLSSVAFSSVTILGSLALTKLPQLNSLMFSPKGIEKASSITVEDTFLNDLSSVRIKSVDTILITNNRKLQKLSMPFVNITKSLTVNSNGNGMVLELDSLETAGEMQISDCKEVSLPKLQKSTGSIKFDKNSFEDFSADKLNSCRQSLTFINNNFLQNISFAELTSVGDLTIQNNTALTSIPLSKLNTVLGGIILRGSFDTVGLDKLSDVKGGCAVTSTTDIGDVCQFFDDAKKHGIIQGSEKCTSNNTKANEGGDGGSTGHGTSGSNAENSAFSLASNMGFALGLMVLTGIAQLL